MVERERLFCLPLLLFFLQRILMIYLGMEIAMEIGEHAILGAFKEVEASHSYFLISLY
jgi:hypothetical protein